MKFLKYVFFMKFIFIFINTTFFNIAVENGNTDIVQLLLKVPGINPNVITIIIKTFFQIKFQAFFFF